MTAADSPAAADGSGPSSPPRTLQALAQRLALAGDVDGIVAFEAERTRRLGYRELAAETEARARLLVRAGVRPGDSVILSGPGGPDWILACLAILRCGACLVPVDSALGGETFRHLLRDSGARFAVLARSTAQRLRRPLDGMGVAVLPLALDAVPDGAVPDRAVPDGAVPDGAVPDGAVPDGAVPDGAVPAPEPVDPESRAILFYTSGTTGPPKGVPLTHANLAHQIRVLAEAGIVSAQDRVLLPLPLHHVYPLVIGVLTPLALGIAIVLPAGFTGAQVVAALQGGRPTLMIGVPRLFDALTAAVAERMRQRGPVAHGLFRAMLRLSLTLRRRLGWRIGRKLFAPLHRRLGPSLRAVVSGGAALNPETAWKMEALGWEVGSGYGLTETSPMLTIHPPGAMRFDAVGRPIAGTALRIAPDADGAGAGEVLAQGPGVFAGYHGLPEKTAAAFTTDGWFRTGDLGRIDDGGWLHLSGRRSTVIVTAGGKNVQPEEIEDAYGAQPAIGEIAVLQHEGRLAALIVPARDALADDGGAAAVREAVRAVSRDLPTYQRLAEYRLSAEPVARTRLGKLRRHLIAERYGRAGEAADQAPARAVGLMPPGSLSDDDRVLLDDEAALAVYRLLGDRFGDRRIGPDSDLQLDLGIDSIGWLDLSLDIADRTGASLSDATIAELRTVRDLLSRIAEGGDAPTDAGASPGHPDQVLDDPERVLDDGQRQWLAPRPASLGPAGRALEALNRFVFRRLFRLTVTGADRLPPAGPIVFVPNHASYLDPFVLGAALGAGRLARTRWAGWSQLFVTSASRRAFARTAGVVPVDVGRATLPSLALGSAVLKRGEALVWFPEGVRSPDGGLRPFKSGLGMILARHRSVPVVPVVIRGTFDAWPASRRLPRLRPLAVEFLAPCMPDELVGETEEGTEAARIMASVRKRIAAALDAPAAAAAERGSSQDAT